jgi:hypothetical protein
MRVFALWFCFSGTKENEAMMTMKNRLMLLSAVLMILAVGRALADNEVTPAAVTTFESCTDSRGHLLAAEADTALPELARVVAGPNGASIHYNPDLLTRLSQNTRIFLYMVQCAAHGIDESGKKMSAAQARLADCMAANTLLTGNVVTRESLPALQSELTFNNEEWKQVPGPIRKFDLLNCTTSITRGNVLHIPLDTPPDGKQVNWNNCVRACADKLWTCQKGCRGAACNACTDTHGECKGACGGSEPPPSPPESTP